MRLLGAALMVVAAAFNIYWTVRSVRSRDRGFACCFGVKSVLDIALLWWILK